MPKFQDKPTVATNDLSNTTAYFPMVQSGLNKKATTTQIKRDAVANCSTAAGTVAKTATIRNMPDFELLSGIVVTVAFTNTNTAESPTLNINNTGAWPIKLENQASNVTIGDGCWVAGAILEFKYVEVSDTEKYWLLVGHNVAQKTSEYTILADGTNVYNKQSVDSQLNSALAPFKYEEVVYQIDATSNNQSFQNANLASYINKYRFLLCTVTYGYQTMSSKLIPTCWLKQYSRYPLRFDMKIEYNYTYNHGVTNVVLDNTSVSGTLNYTNDVFRIYGFN